MGETKISVNNLNLYYGKNHALKNVSMEIKEKAITALIGPSGCGKSTFLKTLNRMNDLVDGVRIEGTIKIDGEDIYGRDIDTTLLRKKVGMVFQRFNLFPHMTVLENVMSPQQIVKKVPKDKAKEKASELLAKVGLSDKEDAYPNKLSGGQ